MNLLDALARSPLWSQPPLAIVANVIVTVAFVLIVAAIVVDFVNYHRQAREVVRSDRSFVETGSMAGFFIAYYLVIRLEWLDLRIEGPVRTVMILVGLILVTVGVVFNIYGRVLLKSSWANQIKIYEGQELIRRGPFAVVRHPLYASLIWIFIGGSLVYANLLSLVLTVSVFIPMMTVRAGKEDALLLSTFGEQFEEYRRQTGMFFPKVRR